MLRVRATSQIEARIVTIEELTRRSKMATYVSLIKWTEQGVKNVKDTVKRVRQGQEAAEKMGGRFLSVYYTQGKYDIVVTTEWPDDETANAYLLSLAATGNIRSQTTRAYSPEEMEGIISKMP
jgi:uncharacterized protein with GYD domain